MRNIYGDHCKCYGRHLRCGCEVTSESFEFPNVIVWALYPQACRVEHKNETVIRWIKRVMMKESKNGRIMCPTGEIIYEIS